MRLVYVLDCADPVALARFWAPALGFHAGRLHPPYLRLRDPRDRLADLLPQQVPEPKQGKNRMHLDIQVTELAPELARLCGVGATVVAEPWDDAGVPDRGARRPARERVLRDRAPRSGRPTGISSSPDRPDPRYGIVGTVVAGGGMATLTGGALDALRDQLADFRSGSIRVVDVQVEARLDSTGEEYVQVTLVISEPPPGQQTWSLDDAFDLRQHVRQAASALGLSSPLSISMTVSGDADTAEDISDEDDSAQASGESA